MEPVRGAQQPEVVIATILERPPRNLSFGPVAVTVKTEDVLHLQRLAPRIQDIPVDEPDPAPTTITVPQPSSAPLPQVAQSGVDGDSRESSGASGGGNSITLLMRFIPKYPIDAALHQQEGLTAASLHVDANGRVRDVKIVRSSGSRSLDAAAVEAFRKWKFAPVPPGSATDGVWVRTEQRFILYRFRYSRLSDRAAENVNVQAVQPATDRHTPGSEKALRRFIDDVRAGTFVGDSDAVGRNQLEKMHAVLEKWGAVRSVEFTGIAGSRNWTAYGIRVGAANGATGRTVEVKWNLFEVEQEHATTEWLVAVDREGAIWAARASPAPWL